MDTLSALVDCSLVRAQTGSGEPRFALLETIREYALEQLARAATGRGPRPARRLLRGPGRAGRRRAHRSRAAALAGPAGDRPRQPAGRDVVAGGPRPARARGAPVPGDVAVLVAARARRGVRRPGGPDGGRSADLPPYDHALALTGVGFILLANGDQARARQVFEQSLPVYGQVSEKLGVLQHAGVLAVLGHLAAIRRDYAGACALLDQGRARLQEVRDDGVTGFDRLQYRLTAALWTTSSGRSGSASTTTTARRGCSPTAWPKGAANRTRSPRPSRSTTWRWPGGPRATRSARRGT